MLEAAAGTAELTGQVRSLIAWSVRAASSPRPAASGWPTPGIWWSCSVPATQIDPEIGGRVFKTKSSEELAHLTGRGVGESRALVRVTGTKLCR